MTTEAARLYEQALALPEQERHALADELLMSIHQTDPRLDALWALEAEARFQAIKSGRMRTYSEEEVFAELDQE